MLQTGYPSFLHYTIMNFFLNEDCGKDYYKQVRSASYIIQ